jgi:putative ABC transport system permease protein
MLLHTLLLIYRNFKRFKTTFFINLIGLSTGLACTLLIYLWVNDELSVDKFHTKDARLFQVMENQHNADGIETSDGTPGPLAEALSEEIPEVELAASVSWSETYTLSSGDKNIKATGQYASKDFFSVFSYRLIHGNADQVLTDKSKIVISRKLAMSLFNTTENIIGKVITLQQEMQFLISGVFEDVPLSASNTFDFILSFEELKVAAPWLLNWRNNAPATYVLLKEGTNVSEFNRKIENFLKEKGGEEHITLFATKYSNNYLYGRYQNGALAGGRIEYVTLFSVIAIFILLIACVNFMNLSTAKASTRIKEVGIKKAIGAGRRTLMLQYLGESMLMTILSVMVSILVVDLLLPQFNEITGKNLSLRFDGSLILSIGGICLFTGLIAGSYPALYLSAFSPSRVLKGKLGISAGNLLARKGLVVFQFTVSVVFIVSVWVVYKQISFVQSANPGYNKDNIVYFDMEGKAEENPEVFLSEIKTIPGVVNASSVGHSLVEGGYGSSTSTFEWEGKHEDQIIEFEKVSVNFGLMETLGMEIKEGRTFSPAFATENASIIINEAAADIMGMNDPLGKSVRVYRTEREIIGVVKDFHFQSMHEEVKPLFLMYHPGETWVVMARIQAGREQETIHRLEAFYNKFNPGFTLDYNFLDAAYKAQYVTEERVGILSRYFAGLAILISCLGLFGLAAFTAEKRIKEIGIRKVLGSSVPGIVILLSADFTKIVLFSILLAFPISYFITDQWLGTFAFKISPEWWYFVGAGLMALAIAWLTVGMQAWKAARVNPVRCLRDE